MLSYRKVKKKVFMENLFLVSSFEEDSTELQLFDRDLVGKKVTFFPTASNVE